jgi:hypothetical protein
MAKLKLAANDAKQQLVNYQKQLPVLTESNSKEVLARQNAPTAMYSDAAGVSTTSSSSNQNNTKTLAGQSIYDDYANQTTEATAVNAVTIAHPDYTIVSGEFLRESVLGKDEPRRTPSTLKLRVSSPAIFSCLAIFVFVAFPYSSVLGRNCLDRAYSQKV